MARSFSSIRITEAGPGHRGFIKRLSAEVFARFGDYETLLPGLLGLPWIRTSIAEVAGEAAGFAMISLEDQALGEVDLVAIAVDPRRQSHGVGRRLLGHVEDETRRLVRDRVAVVRLTVALDNPRALDLFLRSGYVVAGDDPGLYPRGQRSQQMRKALEED